MAGNPNSGKTTLFNAITGARQHVGNYPGVTVEKKQGFYDDNGLRMQIVDLPGTYSLTAYSLEEVVARDFHVDEKPAVVINPARSPRPGHSFLFGRAFRHSCMKSWQLRLAIKTEEAI